MNTLPLFYKKVVPLNKTEHQDLCVEAIDSFAFAAKTNSLYIAAIEFPKAAGEYPIVFGKSSDTVFPVVLLGLQNRQNLFVDKKGRWNAAYIPAYVRRYPFILAQPDGGNGSYTVCIDMSFSGFNTANEGQRLFDPGGKESPLLQQTLKFLQDYQNSVEMTTVFCKALVDLDLLEPMQASIEMKSGDKFAIGGFQCVNRNRLKALETKKISGLLQSDHLELIYAHLLSLNNLNRLIQKIG